MIKHQMLYVSVKVFSHFHHYPKSLFKEAATTKSLLTSLSENMQVFVSLPICALFTCKKLEHILLIELFCLLFDRY